MEEGQARDLGTQEGVKKVNLQGAEVGGGRGEEGGSAHAQEAPCSGSARPVRSRHRRSGWSFGCSLPAVHCHLGCCCHSGAARSVSRLPPSRLVTAGTKNHPMTRD